MAGYSRQSAADIIANAVIKAAPVNAEYNALRDAFALAGGHKHDGSSTEGAYVPLIADTDALNKVVIDTSNNRIGFFTEVSSSAVEQLRIQDGAIVPVTDNDIDLGTSSLEFKDLYIDGVGYLDSVDIDGGSIDGVTIGGSSAGAGTFSSLVATTADINAGTIDSTVIGGTTAAAADFTTMDASGNATVGGTLGVTGNVTMGGTLAVTGTTALTGTATITSADINSGSMDNTTIGNTTAAAGTFTNLTSTGTSTHATVDINGGAIDGVTIGGSSAGAGTFTDLTASGTTTITTADINGGNIDGTVIGSSSAAAGSFTTVSTSGQATLASVDVNGGNIDGTIIGASSAAAITGTTITGTSLLGAVTGNVTGNVTGDVTGDVTGNLTGNVTASSGSSTFNNVTVNGTLDVTGTTIANVTDPSSAQDAATKNYVDTEVAALVDSAPGTLDTLNELAAALGDDPNFSTTITNSIATKLPLAGGTMTGAIAMGTNKITGLGDPTANQDAVTKAFADSNYLALSGGTMTGAIDMGSAKITTTYTPTNNADLTTKTYVDGILGSATAAATSATAAASSATAAASSATAAASSATSAASSATSAAASYDSFDDRYLGAKSSAPSVDNDGDALVTGALYFNSTTDIMNVRTSGGAWTSAGSSVNGTSSRNTYTATAGQTTFSATYDSGYVDVYLNGVKLLAGTDFTATSGTSIVLASGAAVNDIVDIVAYGTFTLADHYDKTASDARYLQLSGGTLTGNIAHASAFTIDTGGDITLDSDSGVIDFDDDTLNFGRIENSSSDFKIESRVQDKDIIFAGNDGGSGINALTLDMSEAGAATFNGDVIIPDKIVHDGDTNTAIRFPAADTVTVETGGSERMRIDSSGNLLVGKTSSNSNTVGIELSSSNLLRVARSGGATAYLNRKTNNGDIITLAKDGTTVGSIGIQTGGLTIDGEANHTGLMFAGASVLPRDNAALTDGSTDLGTSDGRWKDGYFSNTIYANALVHDGDTNTKIEFPAGDEIEIHTGGAARVLISTPVTTINNTLDIEEVIEKVTANTSTSGTINFDFRDQAIINFTANQAANRTINFRADSGTTLNSIMTTGQSVTVAILMAQGSTAYYLNAYQVDGSSVTPKWQGGSAPTAGNASGIDAYSFTIIKTADATFTVLASVTQYA